MLQYNVAMGNYFYSLWWHRACIPTNVSGHPLYHLNQYTYLLHLTIPPFVLFISLTFYSDIASLNPDSKVIDISWQNLEESIHAYLNIFSLFWRIYFCFIFAFPLTSIGLLRRMQLLTKWRLSPSSRLSFLFLFRLFSSVSRLQFVSIRPSSLPSFPRLPENSATWLFGFAWPGLFSFLFWLLCLDL